MGSLGDHRWVIGDGDVAPNSLCGVVCWFHDHVGECAVD